MTQTRRGLLRSALAATVSGLAYAAQTDALPEAPFRRGKEWQPLLNARDLSGWQSEPGWHGVPGRLNEWFTTTAVSWSTEKPKELIAQPKPGGIIVNGIATHTTNLISERKFGDVELYLEFMLSKDSNSGVYMQGLYEVQILDSYGKQGPLKFSDAGGIYEQVDKDNKGFGGTPPRVNASRPPGEWQSFDIVFRAPRFDASGGKASDARFEKVVFNGTVVQENVASGGPTRSALTLAEAPQNPLMLQGDHGPVAFRNIYFRPLG
jgi:hypothetical protein